MWLKLEPKYPEREKSDATEKLDQPNQTDDLVDLLNEAKLTILELQREIEALKIEIEMLREQNKGYLMQIESLNRVQSTQCQPTESQANLLPPNDEAVPIPLEPIVIVKENHTDDSPNKCTNATDKHQPNPKHTAPHVNHSMASDQTSQSDNTFVV